jgi:hypothetical protein
LDFTLNSNGHLTEHYREAENRARLELLFSHISSWLKKLGDDSMAVLKLTTVSKSKFHFDAKKKKTERIKSVTIPLPIPRVSGANYIGHTTYSIILQRLNGGTKTDLEIFRSFSPSSTLCFVCSWNHTAAYIVFFAIYLVFCVFFTVQLNDHSQHHLSDNI